MTGLKQADGHARALARLADEDKGKIETEIVEAPFDLLHRNVDRAGDVSGSKFGAGTHVHEQGVCGWLISQLRDGYGGVQSPSSTREERGFRQKDSGFRKGRFGRALWCSQRI